MLQRVRILNPIALIMKSNEEKESVDTTCTCTITVKNKNQKPFVLLYTITGCTSHKNPLTRIALSRRMKVHGQ